jgi:hypothetical protein
MRGHQGLDPRRVRRASAQAMTDRLSSFDDALRVIAQHTDLQSRFLNTLSLLEYIGARKIIKSQPEESMSLQLLSHAAEELRHARTLKRVAERLTDGASFGYAAGDLLCGEQARSYFQTLDDRVEAELHAGARASYLYATLLIEERALWAYPRIMNAFQSEWVSGACRAILVEEERHLREILLEIQASDPLHAERVTTLRVVEEALFGAFAEALRDQTSGVFSVRSTRADDSEPSRLSTS